MSDPIRAINQLQADDGEGGWTRWLIVYVRALACLSLLKGLYHWLVICGIGDGATSTFESAPLAWRAATIFFAVIDLVAAVGLWLAAAWGGVVWLTAAISMAAIEIAFPQVYGGRLWIAIPEFIGIAFYIALALMAGRERPD